MTAPIETEIDETEPDNAAQNGAESAENAGQNQDGTADLGDAGKKALDAMKAKWRAERDRAKAAEDKLAAATKPPADDDKPDLDAIRKQAREEVQAESLRERALDKLEAKAARLFQNPEDARAFLASKVDDFLDDGKIDVEAIGDALKDLLTDRPYLGVTQGDAKRFQGTGDGGPKGSAGKPQLTKADVEKLAAQGKHTEIEAARVDGRLNTLLGIT